MSSNLLDGKNPQMSFVDKLTIETPEQTALDFAVAGIGSRFIALALLMNPYSETKIWAHTQLCDPAAHAHEGVRIETWVSHEVTHLRFVLGHESNLRVAGSNKKTRIQGQHLVT